eukprot:TRINITY_DN33661_c0_g1_i1.p1 TRINITY_DN33661_c0_g1~~TRINITY_DN33661_c0_g1_i1.p1  ORF type:complete len:200 (+),score=15.15 TRINITY_DN33661_c0_g1_i1:184-783(+)
MVFVEVRFDPSIRHLSKNNQSVWSVDHNKALGLPGSKNNSSFIEHYMGPNLHSRDIPVSEGLGATVDLFLCRDGREIPLDLTKPVKDLNVLPFKSGRDYILAKRAAKPWVPPPAPPKPPARETVAAPLPQPSVSAPASPPSVPQKQAPPPQTQRSARSGNSPSSSKPRAVIYLPVMPPVDWKGFITYWEEQAEREMESL